MKTSKWIRGTLYVLCFSVFVGVLGTCDLQKDDSYHPPKPYYKLEATGYGAEISIVVGFFTSHTLDSLEPIGSWGSNSYSGEGLCEKKIQDDEIGCLLGADHEYTGLFVEAIKKVDDGGPLTTKITHVDENGLEDPLADGGNLNNINIAYAPFWSPPASYHSNLPPGPGWSVICTELYRQGLMDETTFGADEAFGSYLRDNQKEVLIGYHFWAKPVVSLMQKSRAFTQIVNVLAQPWSYEMAYRMGARDKGTFAGKILMFVGVPVCRTIGKVMIWAENIGPRDNADGHENPMPKGARDPTE